MSLCCEQKQRKYYREYQVKNFCQHFMQCLSFEIIWKIEKKTADVMILRLKFLELMHASVDHNLDDFCYKLLIKSLVKLARKLKMK